MAEEEQKEKIEDDLGPCAMVSKKMAARLQIVTACDCLAEGNWLCAITLAGAAEGQIVETASAKLPDLFTQIKKMESSRSKYKSERQYVAFLNRLRDWLKHSSDQNDILIYEKEAAIMVLRALSKYRNTYGDNDEDMKNFIDWYQKKEFWADPTLN